MVKVSKKTKKQIYAFIDASNLFYGGEKSLGWKIDYKKLIKYLRNSYFLNRMSCHYCKQYGHKRDHCPKRREPIK